MKSLVSKVRWTSTLGMGPISQSPAQNEMLYEPPMRKEDEILAVKRAALRMFCACITLFSLNVVLSLTTWQQFDNQAAMIRDNASLRQRLDAESNRRNILEKQLESKQ